MPFAPKFTLEEIVKLMKTSIKFQENIICLLNVPDFLVQFEKNKFSEIETQALMELFGKPNFHYSDETEDETSYNYIVKNEIKDKKKCSVGQIVCDLKNHEIDGINFYLPLNKKINKNKNKILNLNLDDLFSDEEYD